MGDKSPKHENAKKPARSLKEKRADKHAKKAEKRPGIAKLTRLAPSRRRAIAVTI